MSALLIAGSIVAYISGWLVFAVMLIRAFAAKGHCQRDFDRNRHYCRSYHTKDCWSTEIGGIDLLWGGGIAIVWPLAWMPMAALWMAKRSPNEAALQKRIADLERDLGL